MDFEDRNTSKLPRRERANRLTVSWTPDENATESYDKERCAWFATKSEIRAHVDPTDFLDSITVPEILAYEKETHLLLEASEPDRATLLAHLHATDAEETDMLLVQIAELLRDNRTEDATLLIERWRSPVFESEAASKSAYEYRMAHR